METHEDGLGNLVDEKGVIIVPVEQRQQTEVYSRVVGYLRPVRQWNRAKKAEWADRVDFIAPTIESPEVKEGSDA